MAIRSTSSLPLIDGWMCVNNSRRFCCIKEGVLKIAHDETNESVEVSMPLDQIVDAVRVPDSALELDVLPENARPLRFRFSCEQALQACLSAFRKISHNKKWKAVSEFRYVKRLGCGYFGEVSLVAREAEKGSKNLTDKHSTSNKLPHSSQSGSQKVFSKDFSGVSDSKFSEVNIQSEFTKSCDFTKNIQFNQFCNSHFFEAASYDADNEFSFKDSESADESHLVDNSGKFEFYAMKRIPKTKIFENPMLNRVMAERNILIRSNNPFIPKLYAAFQTNKYIVLVMEYVAGGDLQQLLDKDVVFNLDQIKIYLAELIIALHYLHKMGLVFRDLKPSNILLDLDGHLKLTDFGLSKDLVFTNDQSTSSLCGTHEYLAPEMVTGKSYSYAVDWWALGVIAFRLICGYLPFRNPNLVKLYEMIEKGQYRLPRSLDESTKSFLNGLLQKQPELRLNYTKMLSHKFFEGIDWKKVARREYEMQYIPWDARDSILTDSLVNSIDDQKMDSEGSVINDTMHIKGFSYDCENRTDCCDISAEMVPSILI
ncbi:AGC family protein kinase [Tritrichomonas foetus]|uniref:AGC family protein kinase n=1 Tax=Tritrichomonas foetus TaxID=1144522 RepID=A0A1J4JBX5_9EUKA|nr:AGC family protein kinase [Tritrichomonas foetus]|eukprot:OHS94917.1 AGC family protein kinase [Tritrichomonas foetus]